MDMHEQLQKIQNEAIEQLSQIDDKAGLEEFVNILQKVL